MAWPGKERRLSSPEQEEKYLRKHSCRRTHEDSDQGNGSVHIKARGFQAKVSPRRVAATVASILALGGGGWWATEQASKPTIAVPAEEWRDTREYVRKGREDGYPRLAAVETAMSGLKGEVKELQEGVRDLKAAVTTQTLVLLYRDRWEAQKVGDREERNRVQLQIDMMERDLRGKR